MSRSNAAAINRRVNVPAAQLKPGQPASSNTATLNAQNNVQPPQQPSGFTLPQVISVIDTRLVTLEKFMRETQSRPVSQEAPIQYKIQEGSGESHGVTPEQINHIINEFNDRFSIFAQEIAEMKDIVLKLQAYTMDVNKTLLEERIQVFSDLNTPIVSSEPDNNLVTTTNESVSQNSGSDNANAEVGSTSIDLKNLIKQEFSQTSN
jgi:hypothetical protein